MERALSVVILSILCLSIFSTFAPSPVKVGASSPPGAVQEVTGYPAATYELLLWGNPLINGFPDTSVTAFKIYKDGSLLATVDWRTCRYRDYNPVDRWCQYGVSAVNAAGEGPQETFSDWWGSQPNVFYDLTVHCNPPEGGYIYGMYSQNLRSEQTTAGKMYMPAMVTATPAPGYDFTGQWTSSGSISIDYYYPQPICYITNWWGNDAAITAYFSLTPTHDVALYKVEPSRDWASLNDVLTISIGVKNKGTEPESFTVIVYAGRFDFAEMSYIGTLSVNDLQPGQSRLYANEYGVWWRTKYYEKGEYRIRACTGSVIGDADTTDNRLDSSTAVDLQDVGYCIIVEGGYWYQDEEYIKRDCDLVYNTLLNVGFTTDRILYLHHPTLVEFSGYAIETWAMSRVSEFEPLLLFLSDHGEKEEFILSGSLIPPTEEVLSSSNLAYWLHELKSTTNAPIHTLMFACHSGSFINELAIDTKIVISSCTETQDSRWFRYEGPNFVGPWFNPFYDAFWKAIGEGFSVKSAFNIGSEAMGEVLPVCGVQDPLLDDNNDGVGSPWPLGNGDDGRYASFLHIGHCNWSFPWVSGAVATQYFAWPPPAVVTLWAKVENDTVVRRVVALMIPPDWSPPESEVLDLACFEMTDADHNGNYTVTIPELNFTTHASGPSEFRFIIFVEQEDNMTAYPRLTSVVFTETGQPSADNAPPTVYVTRPLDDDIVHGTIDVNGTTSDGVCLQKIELYTDSGLTQAINLPKASNSFFEFSLNTMSLSNGNHTLMVKSYDTSSNSANQSLSIYVINDVHDIVVINAAAKPVVAQGFNLTVPVAVVNQGTYAESFNVILYLNSTIIETKSITDLPIDALITLTFAWDTSSFAKGNYTIIFYATPVPGEINTGDNTYTYGPVLVTLAGDVDGDSDVDYDDFIVLAGTYGSSIGQPTYNPEADIDGDGDVDYDDFIALAGNYGQQWP